MESLFSRGLLLAIISATILMCLVIFSANIDRRGRLMHSSNEPQTSTVSVKQNLELVRSMKVDTKN